MVILSAIITTLRYSLCTSVVRNLHFTLFKLLIKNRPAAL